jgi:WD40 repeat protein
MVAELQDAVYAERAVFSPDGRWLAIAGGDASIRFWETSRWQKIRMLHGHTGPVTSLDFSPNGHFLATAPAMARSNSGPWMNRRPRPSGLHFRHRCFSNWPQMAAASVVFFSLNRPTVSHCGRRRSGVPPRYKRSFTVTLPGPPISGAVLGGGRGLVLGGDDGSIRISGPIVGNELVVSNAHKGEVYIMDVSLDGSTLATKGKRALLPEEQVRIWRLPGLQPIAELSHAYNVHGIKLSDDGKWLAGFTGPGDMGVWEIPSMKDHRCGEASRLPGESRCALFHPTIAGWQPPRLTAAPISGTSRRITARCCRGRSPSTTRSPFLPMVRAWPPARKEKANF